jgi:hypothetical protein
MNLNNTFEEIKNILSVEKDIHLETSKLLNNLNQIQSDSKNLLNGLSANFVMDNLKTEMLLDTLISNFGNIQLPDIYKNLDSDAILDDLISKFCNKENSINNINIINTL